MQSSDAIDLAINECIEKGILKDILTKQRGEVHMSILETFDQELYERDLKKSAKQEAHMEIIQKKLAKGKSVGEIADALETSVEEVQKLMEQMK